MGTLFPGSMGIPPLPRLAQSLFARPPSTSLLRPGADSSIGISLPMGAASIPLGMLGLLYAQRRQLQSRLTEAPTLLYADSAPFGNPAFATSRDVPAASHPLLLLLETPFTATHLLSSLQHHSGPEQDQAPFCPVSFIHQPLSP